MNKQEAHAIVSSIEELRAELKARVPKTTQGPGVSWDSESDTYDLDSIDVDNMMATYRIYLGRGEYEYTCKDLDLDELFGDEA